MEIRAKDVLVAVSLGAIPIVAMAVGVISWYSAVSLFSPLGVAGFAISLFIPPTLYLLWVRYFRSTAVELRWLTVIVFAIVVGGVLTRYYTMPLRGYQSGEEVNWAIIAALVVFVVVARVHPFRWAEPVLVWLLLAWVTTFAFPYVGELP